jgi:uncharacterized protein YabE (DUF348 family)
MMKKANWVNKKSIMARRASFALAGALGILMTSSSQAALTVNISGNIINGCSFASNSLDLSYGDISAGDTIGATASKNISINCDGSAIGLLTINSEKVFLNSSQTLWATLEGNNQKMTTSGIALALLAGNNNLTVKSTLAATSQSALSAGAFSGSATITLSLM